jgi:hypothetical protein
MHSKQISEIKRWEEELAFILDKHYIYFWLIKHQTHMPKHKKLVHGVISTSPTIGNS